MFAIFILVASSICSFTFANPAPLDVDPLIVGGTPAGRHEFPWIVMMRINGRQACGGTILNENWILTAAHCSNYPAANYTIIAGLYRQSVHDASQQTSKVSKVVVHEQWNKANFHHDIALMQLATPLTFTKAVDKATLAGINGFAAKKMIVAGWGTTSSGGQVSDVLLKVTVPHQPDAKCEQAYKTSYFKASQICAGAENKDSCQGDSGGPLHNSNNRRVVGIVSFGEGCADAAFPGVYTKIPHYVSWISNHMK